MAALGFATPLLPGRTPVLRELAKACAGERRRDFDASQARLGVTRELWWVQGTPAGDVGVVVLEAPDPGRAMQGWAASRDAFDAWTKQRLREATGIDFGQPGPPPPVRQLVDLSTGERAPTAPVAFASPILPGKAERNLAYAKELQARHAEYLDQCRRAGIVRKMVWQHDVPGMPYSLVFLEAKDPARVFATWATGQQPFDAWFRQNIKDIHGFDLTQPGPPPPELILDWTAR